MPRRFYPSDPFRDGDSARMQAKNQKYTEWARRQEDRGFHVTLPTQTKESNMTKSIFVFGSNEAGIHGAGAARTAYKKHGARWGMGYGHYGSSFAIPTKDVNIESLDLARIRGYVQGFLAYAKGHPELTFQVTRIGCGLAGNNDADMAAMFVDAPENCKFDEVWKPLFNGWGMGLNKTYWGTF